MSEAAKELERVKQNVATDLRDLRDRYRYSGRIFEAALIERFLNGVPTVPLPEPLHDTEPPHE